MPRGEAKVSRNVWAMRCVEFCLEGFPTEMTAIWSIARGLTVPWDSDKNEDAEVDSYKFKTAVEALNKIADLVENFEKRRFGTDDLSKISRGRELPARAGAGRPQSPLPALLRTKPNFPALTVPQAPVRAQPRTEMPAPPVAENERPNPVRPPQAGRYGQHPAHSQIER
jgi:hypothetical protein